LLIAISKPEFRIDIEQFGSNARVNFELEIESSNPKDRPNLTQRCKRFATALTSTQVAVLPWRYDAEMGTANLFDASA